MSEPSASSSSGSPAPPRGQKRPFPSVLNGIGGTFEDKSSDYLCPICFDLIEAAHITRCGHTFCYRCVSKSLEQTGRCPKCNCVLGGVDTLVPNSLLNELVAKHRTGTSKRRVEEPAPSPQPAGNTELRSLMVEHCQMLKLNEVSLMLEVLTRRKQQLEAESRRTHAELLREFLAQLLHQRRDQFEQLRREVALVEADLATAESRVDDVAVDDVAVPTPDVAGFNVTGARSDAGLSSRRKKVHVHFDDLVQCYFGCRSREVVLGGGDATGLDSFSESLAKFCRYQSLRPLATLNYTSDIFNNSSIVSSIEFDRDNEYFAIAGVTKRIKVFDYGVVVKDAVDIHYPCVEMLCNSKISCVSWSSYHKGLLASSDYEGTVTVWDANTATRTRTFQEHEKRCWSVDFNRVDTKLIASGSDDSRVKLWSINVDHSVACLEAKANVCCVKFNPESCYHLAFGSADHCVHYYDLRSTKEALALFKGHRKAVSYVKFVSRDEIVSASTDSQLKLWDIGKTHSTRSFVGHVNEKNFVGLATDGDYVACGSENNALYVYYKGLSKQLFNFRFDAVRGVFEKDRKEDDANEFVSAVCWRQGSDVVVAANSQGTIKILELV